MEQITDSGFLFIAAIGLLMYSFFLYVIIKSAINSSKVNDVNDKLNELISLIQAKEDK